MLVIKCFWRLWAVGRYYTLIIHNWIVATVDFAAGGCSILFCDVSVSTIGQKTLSLLLAIAIVVRRLIIS